jgi:hypothetical protein
LGIQRARDRPPAADADAEALPAADVLLAADAAGSADALLAADVLLAADAAGSAATTEPIRPAAQEGGPGWFGTIWLHPVP